MTIARADTAPQPASGDAGSLASIAPLGRITPEQERELARAWREQGSRPARDRLITANLRLVVALAKRRLGRGVPLEDLVAEGNLGLLRAADHFDPAMGCRFSTYAVYWIRRAIGRAFANDALRTKISERDRGHVRALVRATEAFMSANGRPPSDGELLSLTGWDSTRLQLAKQLRQHSAARISLDAEPRISPALVSVRGPAAPGERLDEQLEARRRALSLLNQLTHPERRALELYFGVDGGQARPTSAVAEIMQTPIRATNALIRTALARLSRASAAEPEHPRTPSRRESPPAGNRGVARGDGARGVFAARVPVAAMF